VRMRMCVERLTGQDLQELSGHASAHLCWGCCWGRSCGSSNSDSPSTHSSIGTHPPCLYKLEASMNQSKLDAATQRAHQRSLGWLGRGQHAPNPSCIHNPRHEHESPLAVILTADPPAQLCRQNVGCCGVDFCCRLCGANQGFKQNLEWRGERIAGLECQQGAPCKQCQPWHSERLL